MHKIFFSLKGIFHSNLVCTSMYSNLVHCIYLHMRTNSVKHQTWHDDAKFEYAHVDRRLESCGRAEEYLWAEFVSLFFLPRMWISGLLMYLLWTSRAVTTHSNSSSMTFSPATTSSAASRWKQLLKKWE